MLKFLKNTTIFKTVCNLQFESVCKRFRTDDIDTYLLHVFNGWASRYLLLNGTENSKFYGLSHII